MTPTEGPSASPPRAVIVTVGDELLSGRTVDSNAAWLGRFLADEAGIAVVRRSTVGDEADAIAAAVADALEAAELVLVTGGLGPTPDDLTRDAVAALLGRPLAPDPDVLERIRRRFEAAGRPMPGPNHRVAQVPAGARILANPLGTAPGLALEADGRWVVLMPGVPREMKAMAAQGLRPLLDDAFGGRLARIHVRHVHTTGIAESALAEAVAERLPDGPGSVAMAFLPDERGVDLRFTVVGGSADEADAAFDTVEGRLADLLAPWRFEAPASGDLVEAVLAALRGRGWTFGTAESCTGGLVAQRITAVPGASDVFVGSVVAYADETKTALLDVSEEDLAAHGAVSGVVAARMAEGARRRLGVDAAVAVTGVAGPGGGSEAKPVGTVWYAAAVPEGVAKRHAVFPGDRNGVRERSAQAALALLLHLLDGRARPEGE